MIELVGPAGAGKLNVPLSAIKQVLYREAQFVRHLENCRFVAEQRFCSLSEAEIVLDRMQQGEQFTFPLPPIESTRMIDHALLEASGTTNFDIFSVYLCNFFSLLAIKAMLEEGCTYQDIHKNSQSVRDRCHKMKQQHLPRPVKIWRNKVAAHFAASNPDSGDNIATIVHSVNVWPSFITPYCCVGKFVVGIDNTESQLEEWSVTKVFEDLSHFWPELKLAPLVYHEVLSGKVPVKSRKELGIGG